MSERMKKILLVSLFVLSVFGFGFAIYYMFFRPAPPAPTVEEGETPFGILPGALEGGPPTAGPIEGGALPEADEIARGGLTKTTVLTTNEISNVTLSTDGQGMNFYNPEDARFYTIKEDGTIEAISKTKFPEVEDVAWNSEGTKAVIEFPDGSNIVYNFDTETQVTLPEHWEDFEFVPDSDEIIAKSIGIDPGNRALVVSNDDGSRVQAVQALGDNADKVQINPSPNDQVIAFSDTGEAQDGFARKLIIPVGKAHENFKGLIVEGLGFTSLWSPRGDTILYSVAGETSDYKPQLWLVNGSPNSIGDDRKSLGIYTWVDKCTFASNTLVYCAVPQELDANVGLLPALADGTPDDVYTIDLSSGRASLMARPNTGVTMENLRVTSDGSTLYYTNQTTGRLESIRLN